MSKIKQFDLVLDFDTKTDYASPYMMQRFSYFMLIIYY